VGCELSKKKRCFLEIEGHHDDTHHAISSVWGNKAAISADSPMKQRVKNAGPNLHRDILRLMLDDCIALCASMRQASVVYSTNKTW